MTSKHGSPPQTPEMGLALVEVADAILPYPEVIAYLGRAEGDAGLDGLATFAGGQEGREAIEGYLARYGMRCAEEIDITRMRWCEKPAMLAPVILGNIENPEERAGKRRFVVQVCREAEEKERDVLARLLCMPEGEAKAEKTACNISIIQNFNGYREYPKYAMVSRYFLY